MNKPYLLIGLFVLCFHPLLQAQSWIWEKTGGSVGDDGIFSVATDIAGNIVIAGYFSQVLQIPGLSPIQPYGDGDAFLIKYLPDGTLFWFVHIGGTGNDFIRDIQIDLDGNVYVLGDFESDLEIGSIDNLPLSGTSEAEKTYFLAKYNSNGVLQWGNIGNIFYSGIDGEELYFDHQASSFDVNQNGEIIITGHLVDDAGTGSDDVYLYRYDPSGGFITGYRSLGSSLERGTGVQFGPGGNHIVLTGYFFNELNILNTNEFLFGNLSEIFVSKYTNDLDLIWSKSAGSNGEDAAGGVAIDGGNNIFITGLCQNNASFGPFTVSTNGGQDFFVAKYNGNGTIQWIQTGGSDGNDFLSKIEAAPDGSLYLLGSFENNCLFDDNNISIQSNNGSKDILFIKYLSNGAVDCYQTIGSINEDIGGDIAVGQNGLVIVGGAFSNSIQLSQTVASNGQTDFFAAVLDKLAVDVEPTPVVDLALSLHPNPVDQQLHYNLEGQVMEQIDIYRADGTLVFSENGIERSSSEIDVSLFAQGLYYFKATHQNNVLVKSFLIQR
ncbi:MAG: T9SS type A sorting domain-containing protein [Bacteroidota bacterium]